MTSRKPKPRKPAPRKASGPTLEQRVAALEEWTNELENARNESHANIKSDFGLVAHRINALESRERLRDKSHDEPVSNAGECIGLHFRIVGELPSASWWRRFLNFMRAP